MFFSVLASPFQVSISAISCSSRSIPYPSQCPLSRLQLRPLTRSYLTVRPNFPPSLSCSTSRTSRWRLLLHPRPTLTLRTATRLSPCRQKKTRKGMTLRAERALCMAQRRRKRRRVRGVESCRVVQSVEGEKFGVIKSELFRCSLMKEFALTRQRFPCGEYKDITREILGIQRRSSHKHLLTLPRPVYPPKRSGKMS